MSHSFRSHYFHLIWSTKERSHCITNEIEPRLYAYIGGIVRGHQATLLKIGGTHDHVHLLIAINMLDKFTSLIRDVKAKSSLWVHQNFPHEQGFAWQEGYASFSVSYSIIDKIKKYIEKQKEHHKTFSFEEEFLLLLKKNDVAHDKRYVF